MSIITLNANVPTNEIIEELFKSSFDQRFVIVNVWEIIEELSAFILVGYSLRHTFLYLFGRGEEKRGKFLPDH